MSHPVFNLHEGASPILISIPHLGTQLPEDIADCYNETAATLADTDWHLDRLYDFSSEKNATTLSARISRYVIDLNRPPDGASLYPGQTTTGLCSLDTFRGEPIYRPGMEPDQAEIDRRIAMFWRPYHHELRRQIERIKAIHGFVLLWEAHSIASELPRLFDGTLPDLNFGTFENKSAGPEIALALEGAASRSPYSWVMNGRFKGGYITRQYGAPRDGVHAVQLEMSQKIYMDEFYPFNYREDKACDVRPHLAFLLDAALEAAKKSAKDSQ